jgi:hypothetical protein
MPLKMRIADKNTFFIQYFCTDNRAICEVKVEEYGRVGQVTDDNTTHGLCMLDN